MRYFSVSGCVQNILTLHFYQQFDLIAIIYRRLREAWVIPSTIKRWGKKKQLVNRPQNGVAIWIQCSEEGLNQFVTA